MEVFFIVFCILAIVFVPSKKQRLRKRMRRSVPVFYRGETRYMNGYNIKRCIEIVSNSLQIVTTTKKVDIALSRLDLAIEESKVAEYLGRKLRLDVPDSIIKIAQMTDEDYTDSVRQILENTLRLTIEDANALKTEQGRKNRITSYFTKLSEFAPKIPKELYPWIHAKAVEVGVQFKMP